MTGSQFQSHLLDSLQFGFIDSERFQEQVYSPQILINDSTRKRFVLTDLQEELSKSLFFYFSVAFVTQSGLALIKSQLLDLALKGNQGKILISPYLDFNDPLAMKELLKLKNVQIRLSPVDMQLHSKYYLFEQGEKQVVIAGSSNLTGNALKKNYEWNVKLTSTENGDFIEQTKKEFERIWNLSIPLTEDVINRYQANRKPILQIDIAEEEVTFHTKEIVPNAMQKKALEGLQSVRDKKEKRALVISATGTGKTYLSALDVKQMAPNRVLFIVHREQILSKALESFQRVLQFSDSDACIYKTGLNIDQKKYIFATIQTISRDEHLKKFAKDHFDYILIDEVHKAGADTYRKVMDYFTPKFLLGMTATPERTDGQNIYELFDYNIAYEIRLQEALDNDLLCPFIYFGVTDLEIDGHLIAEDTSFSQLTSDERVKHILSKINYYGHSGENVHGLIFCSSKKEVHELSLKLNQAGLRTQALTGDDSHQTRENAIKNLENGHLDYILTVDIFNEGIDIPSINQVVMLRNTESSIIFVQQLGRGLRKHLSKEYVTIIDFIGNYKNNYLIPVALFGDKSMNKDNYRREIREGNLLNGLTTINFEEVAKHQIFDAITNNNLANIKILRDHFIELRNKIGRIPYLYDFVKNGSIEPQVFFNNANFKNYGDVINKFSDKKIVLDETANRFLSFITFELLNGKRQHDLHLLKLLVENEGKYSIQNWIEWLSNHNLSMEQSLLESVERVLDLSFLKMQEKKKFGEVALVKKEGDYYILNSQMAMLLKQNPDVKHLFCDVIETGLLKSKDYPTIFTIGQKYTRRDVLKLLNIKKDEPPLNISGYKIDKDTNTCPIFITYHKSDEISNSIKYDDQLINESTLRYFSKNKRTLSSPDVDMMIHSHENGLRLPLFIIKNTKEGGEFYYLGDLEYLEGSASEVEKNEQKVVQMYFKLKSPIDYSLYKYITSI
ncbi:DUF3427 domain-containing protein [Streptococcus phocae]|uniref:Helicase n=1 Tax=Streptococcus phocae TaxID=119224 RepID=A0A0P6S3B7_9STRE|nr:DEAD/DEAH box helicase [Streptococcus phocae]KPJ22604.1 helicase [Streptococcus phocae]